ncbi:CHASE4 domain-containing protein [Methanobacterium veterum]|uniref:histidine kinase n=1 Tax=Methanobacterium veterum TaxID=408577 RepID=A0A9E5A419_9EURY|nr:CHASE4 domain-containing protein [Methanobacterium veterum]MCZ3372191.1 PAS domain S-box protein [Methanobacterium veterum]
MKLRGKTLVLMAVIILSLTVSFFIISELIFVGSSSESENSYTKLVLNNTLNSLNNSLESLNNSANDWSSWNDAYYYVNGDNPNFLNKTLVNDAFLKLNIDFILFANNDGKIIYAEAYNKTSQKEIKISSNMTQSLKNNGLMLDTSNNKSLSGIIIINGIPMIVVSNPVLKSNGEGPSHGTLIMGRFLNQDMLSSLSNSGLVSVQPVTDTDAPSDFLNAMSHLSNETPVYVTNLSHDSVAGYSVLKGVNGSSNLVLKVELPRFINNDYENAIFYLILSLIIMGFLAAMFITYYLDKNVLYRLDQIIESITGIGKKNDLSKRVPVLGNDELADLSTSVNNMLGSLQESNSNLEKSEERYRMIFENTGTAMVIIGEGMAINLVNDEFEKMTGFLKGEIENKKNLMNFVVKDHLDKIENHHSFNEFKDKNTLNSYEVQLKTKNGDIKDLFATFGFIPETKQALISFIDVTDRKKAEEELKRHAALLDISYGAIFSWSFEEGILSWNQGAERLYGYSRGEAAGKISHELLKTKHPQGWDDFMEKLDKYDMWTGELIHTTKNGEELIMESRQQLIQDSHGKNIVIETNRDITERKKSEDKIKASLKEKEVLLREIHHRVKNNLQIISTLLQLQADEITDHNTLENYRESENRIQSIALIHEKMYQSRDISNIDFTSYIKSLINDLMYSYDADSRNIKSVIDTGNFLFSIETVQPLGLIVNEIISNSLKYAFKDKNEGTILVKLQKMHSNNFKLTVSDNGMGFPENIDFRNTSSLGLQLVNELVKQLEGNIELNIDNGTEFVIVFKEPEYKKRV